MAKDDLKMGCENGNLFLSEPLLSVKVKRPTMNFYARLKEVA
ncbi:MAG: hypothetical protein V3W19_00670 [Desulfatiglandales bacterium]